MKLEEKIAIVTGAGAGIGAASAALFVREGAKVIAVNIDPAALAQTSAQRTSADILNVVADVSKRNDVDLVVRTALDKYGRIDILFNNAGSKKMVEVQGTAEQHPFDDAQLAEMLGLAKAGIEHLIVKQQAVLGPMVLSQ